jgi:type I restriction enzyme, S subunit
VEIAKLKDVVNYRKQFIEIDDDTKYKRCRVQLHRRGVKLRDKIFGANIKTKKQRLCKANDFIVAEMDAKFGGYGIIPNDLKGAIVSSHYYLYELKPDKLLPMFLEVIIDSGELQEQIKAVGSTNYSRISAKEVLEYEIPCPSLQTQQKIVNYYFRCKDCATELKQELTHQQTLLKKLRQQILQEAIEGKLTADWRAENPDVEPAYELLERIRAEKAQLIKDKKIKKQKPLPPIREEEKPFELPVGWVWCRIEQIIDNKKYALKAGPFGSSLTKSTYVESGYKVYGQEQVIKQNPHYGNYYISEDKYNELLSCAVAPDDLLLSLVGTIGKLLILPKDIKSGIINPRLIKITLHRKVDKKYFSLLYSTLFVQKQLKSNASGQTMDVVSIKTLKKLYLPLPPLPEQKAIAAKVEKLLTLCDQLETQIASNQSHSEQLMHAVLKEAFTQTSEKNEQATDHA